MYQAVHLFWLKVRKGGRLQSQTFTIVLVLINVINRCGETVKGEQLFKMMTCKKIAKIKIEEIFERKRVNFHNFLKQYISTTYVVIFRLLQ